MDKRAKERLPLGPARLWLLLSVYCSVAGWALSAFGALTAAGWAIAFVAFLFLTPLAGIDWGRYRFSGRRLGALWRRRFCRPLPLLFLTVAVLVFLRGFCNPGVYYCDVSSYRTPRVLHWLAEHHWYWIPTNDARFNNRGVGFEWMSCPLLAWTKSDHLLTLLTAIPFCLLPGLVFVAFRGLRVRARVAWYWAWITPMIYCIVLQAGTGMTDGFAAFYALAALAFALEARRRGRVAFLYHAVLAAAFLIAVKASNLPLLLPIGLAVLPALPLARRVVPALAVGALALGISFLPIAVMNVLRLGDWSGLAAEAQTYRPADPLAATAFNVCLLGAYAVAPPILPLRHGVEHLFSLSPALQAYVDAHFEESYGIIHRRTDEAWCGFGFTVTLALLPFVAILLRRWLSGRRISSGFDWETAIRCAVWISLVVVMAKSSLFALPRILAPYYPLLLPTFLIGTGAEALVRCRAWRWCAVGAVAVCLLPMVLSTATPPWPLTATIHALERRGIPPGGPWRSFYNTYGLQTRLDDFHSAVVRQLPPDPVVGLVRIYGGYESCYWEPFGSRRIEQVLPDDTRESLLRRGIRYVIWQKDDAGFNEELRKLDAEVIGEFPYADPNGDTAPTIRLLRLRQKD